MEVFIKLLHVAMVTVWLAGALYMPRLFQSYCRSADDTQVARVTGMLRRLYFVVMTPGAILAVMLGNVLIFYGIEGGWLPLKLSLVLLLILFHLYCGRLLLKIEKRQIRRMPAYYGLLGLVPVPLIVAIVVLAVAKPL